MPTLSTTFGRTSVAFLGVGLSGGLVLGAAPAAGAAAPVAQAASAPAAAASYRQLAALGPLAAHSCASASSRPTLRYDSRGQTVRYVQRRLGVHPRSGWFGPITKAAVKRFQRRNGLRASGVFGPRTWRALLCSTRASRSSYRGIPARVQRLNWRALGQCEASGNPRALNPSGKYRGLYQFDLPTWNSVGGSGDPARASVREQTYRAQRLYVRRGSSPWPQCGWRLYS